MPPLYAYSAGFLGPSAQARRVRAILAQAGWSVRIGQPGPGATVAAWGEGPRADRARRIADRFGAAILHVEDAPLRSLRPGRTGEPTLGLWLDSVGPHWRADLRTDLERHLATAPFDDGQLMRRARSAIARIGLAGLSKYNDWDRTRPLPPPGYALVVDQARGDRALCGAGRAEFAELLALAQIEQPGAPVLIRTHPETALGHRPGHYGPSDRSARVAFADPHLPPRALMDGAVAVYTRSSTLGFEAILAGHRPVVTGAPWYAGWGLTDDRADLPHRGRRLTRAQLVAGALIDRAHWHDPHAGGAGTLEDALGALEAQARARHEDRAGWALTGMRRWKRRAVSRMLGGARFADPPERAARLAERTGRRLGAWASRPGPASPHVRIEDGFLRSRGLGAALVPPLSLVLDDLGAHFDPSTPSRLERLIAEAAVLSPDALIRASDLAARLRTLGLGKYNEGLPPPELPRRDGRTRVLVVGQVEDDASIRFGAGELRSNAALLAAVRAERPEACLLYKPHPDVAAGLRPGAVDPAAADHVLPPCDPIALLAQIDRVETITSTLGFEALIREVPVTVRGLPFYAGWGLTDDRMPAPARRTARPTLDALVHACLIAYARYLDPVTGLPCTPEVAIRRLCDGSPSRPVGLRLLARAQTLRRR